jgi:hypothetical protein
MVAGSIGMWMGNPLFWLWVASMMSDVAAPTLAPIVVFLAGTALTMVPFGFGLGRLDRAHLRLRGGPKGPRTQQPWMRSMRAERTQAGTGSVLEVVMVSSVSVALVLVGAWFLLFAGSPLPT